MISPLFSSESCYVSLSNNPLIVGSRIQLFVCCVFFTLYLHDYLLICLKLCESILEGKYDVTYNFHVFMNSHKQLCYDFILNMSFSLFFIILGMWIWVFAPNIVRFIGSNFCTWMFLLVATTRTYMVLSFATIKP